ncbi:hypothetical protein [Jannaschia pohangensis]|uniref:Uncharacterized protein n=1 Tax=Jannaschia pohangensis TaxID=390807 RepID=A0A1I3II16_9RHOB|nr:hypothetical protein [Jannaschia pohangensis]SFI47572.1 hypothetical protein SAMN04488095_0979 [Jannaschia pohangensis]
MRHFLIATALILPSPVLAQGIVPQDGTWTSTAEVTGFSDACPDEIQPILDQMSAAFDQTEEHQIVWDGTFDPNTLPGNSGDGIVWTQVTDTDWTGLLAPAEMGTTLADVTMGIRGPDRIESEIEMYVGALLAARGMALSGLDDCTARIAMNWTAGD